MGDTSLSPGFRFPCGVRFHPTDVELVMYYLKRKVMGKSIDFEAISEVDIYEFDPEELPEKSSLKTGDLKLYFFCPMEKKYSTGSRMNRATKSGHWKTTGEDKSVTYKGKVVGMRKTLIFHLGKSPKGNRKDWVMHEYRLEDNYLAEIGVQGACVLSVIFEKSGKGPKNGAQYGAPFKEEDWDDDEEVDCVEANVLPSNHDSSVATGTYFHESICVGSSSVSCLSDIERSHSKVLPPGPSNNVLSTESPQVLGGDSLSMMDIVNENDRNEMHDNLSHDGNAEGDELTPRENGYDFSTGQNDQFPTVGNAPYLELSDLNSPLNLSAEAGQSQHNPTDGYNSYINSENDRNEMLDNLSHDGNAEGDESSIYKDLSDFEDLDILQISDLDTPLNIAAEAGLSQHNPTDGFNSYINSEQSCYPVDASGMGRKDKQSQTLSQSQSQSRPSVTWNKEMDHVLAAALYEQLNQGNKDDGHWKPQAYQTAMEYVNAKLKLNLNKDNIKNRLNAWKQHYAIITDIKSHQSGLVWDEEKKMVVVTIDNLKVWNDYIEENKRASGYQTKL